MQNQEKFFEFRSKYPEFIYEKYEIIDEEDNYKLIFTFNIPNLASFTPTTLIPKKSLKNSNIDQEYFEELVFHVGLIELVSYFKCTCSPNVIIKCGYLDLEQINWFKKLYYNGLGEFLYQNGITISEEELMHITCLKEKRKLTEIEYQGVGNLIPIGGGKDSVVTLELLNYEKEINSPFIINPKEVTINSCKVDGYSEDDIIAIKRTIDKNLLELNKQGFLNGHTPFSSLVAFLTYLCAYLSGKRYILLSNEASANEPTVPGTNINHQYSKTYEFESDFNYYTKKYFNIEIDYFSFLRPLHEIQIGMLFSRFEKYHNVVRSCNIGSKSVPWEWCCNCPKCLFVYIILSPFLKREQLINMFGEDLYCNTELLNTFIELLGYSKTKPFECIGTYHEVRLAVSLVIKNYEGELPYLLNYYNDNYPLELDDSILSSYNEENNLPLKFESILKEELKNEKYNN